MWTQQSEALRSLNFSAGWFICSTHRSSSPRLPLLRLSLLSPSMWFLFGSCCSITGISGKLDELSLQSPWMHSPDECESETKCFSRATHSGDALMMRCAGAGCFWTVCGNCKQQWLIQFEKHNLFYRTLDLWKDTVSVPMTKADSCMELQDVSDMFAVFGTLIWWHLDRILLSFCFAVTILF